MPFYDYKCAACGRITEVQHGMNEKPEGVVCPACGHAKLARVFQVVGWLGSSGGGSSSGGSCSACSSGACSSCGH